RPATETVVANETPEPTRVDTTRAYTVERHTDRRGRQPLVIGTAVLVVLVIMGIVGYAVLPSDKDHEQPSAAPPPSTSQRPGRPSPSSTRNPTGGESKQPTANETPSTPTG